MDDKDVRSRAREAADDAAHSGAADKSKGRVKETIGKVKETIGRATGNEKLELKGDAQRAEGKKDRFKGEIKDKVDDAKQYVKAGAELVKEKVSGRKREER